MLFGIGNLSTYLVDHEEAYVYYDDSTEEDSIDQTLTNVERHFVVILLIVTFVLGLYSNARLAFLASARMKVGILSWVFILGIAIAQLLILIIALPTAAVAVKMSTWPFGDVMCKLSNYLITVWVTVDVISLVAMTIENYKLITGITTRPLRSPTKRRNCLILATTVCVSLLAMAPRLALYKVQDLLVLQDIRHVCTRNFGPIGRRQADTSLVFAFHFLVPAVLAAFYITCSHRKLTKITKVGGEYSQYVGNELLHAYEIIRVSSAFGITYLIGWLPVHVVSFLQEFYDYGSLAGREIYAFCIFLMTFAISPLIVMASVPSSGPIETGSSESLQEFDELSNTDSQQSIEHKN